MLSKQIIIWVQWVHCLADGTDIWGLYLMIALRSLAPFLQGQDLLILLKLNMAFQIWRGFKAVKNLAAG